MTRTQLCTNRMLAKKADVDSIYFPYLEGGRGLMNLEKECHTVMLGFTPPPGTLGKYQPFVLGLVSWVLTYHVVSKLG